jgi:hypothetical protein
MMMAWSKYQHQLQLERSLQEMQCECCCQRCLALLLLVLPEQALTERVLLTVQPT